MSINLKQNKSIHRLTLIHQTDVASAKSIIESQRMNPGSPNGDFGAGIYFANTTNATDLKANHRGTYICADVYVGKFYPCPDSDRPMLKANMQAIKDSGFNSVIGFQLSHGREIVAFESSQVKNIKYCLGVRPDVSFRTKKKRLALFIVTNRNDASKIVSNQMVPKSQGPFGFANYFFDSITDALNVHADETYLMADVKMIDFHLLKSGDKVDSKKMPAKYRSFYGWIGNIQYFVIKDPKLISNIHFCGGQHWN